jgi:hypothetical protein
MFDFKHVALSPVHAHALCVLRGEALGRCKGVCMCSRFYVVLCTGCCMPFYSPPSPSPHKRRTLLHAWLTPQSLAGQYYPPTLLAADEANEPLAVAAALKVPRACA